MFVDEIYRDWASVAIDDDGEDEDDGVNGVDRSRSAGGMMTTPSLLASDGEESEAEQLGAGLGVSVRLASQISRIDHYRCTSTTDSWFIIWTSCEYIFLIEEIVGNVWNWPAFVSHLRPSTAEAPNPRVFTH